MVACVRFHPNAHFLLTASADKTCRLWDIRAPGGGGAGSHCARVLDGAAAALLRCDASPKGDAAAAVDLRGGLHSWDLGTGKRLGSAKAHAGPAYSCRYAACGRAIATSGKDRSLKIWDVASLSAGGDEPAFSLDRPGRPVFDATWTPGNLCLAAGPLLD